MLNNIVYQLHFTPEISTIYGPSDYRDFRTQLEKINCILESNNLEIDFITKALKSADDLTRKVPYLRMALRTLILLNLLNDSYRGLAFRLADSALLHWFIGISAYARLKPPSKSSIQRFEHFWSSDDLREFIEAIIKSVCNPTQSETLLCTSPPLRVQKVYADSTCVKAHIHHPVDWLLFRDAIRTLMQSIELIRSQGLLHRMKEPKTFLSKVNNLSIAMSQCSRNRNGKKERKKIFRRMKKLLQTVEKHAQRYHGLLSRNWKCTDLSKKQVDQILQRMSAVIKQVRPIIDLAHMRIISEKKVPNAQKILSLYEKDVHVIKRGKMEADIEFGNGLYLAEQEDGLIVDWQFMKKRPHSDSKLLKQSVGRLKENYSFSSFATDRGFASKNNDALLKKLSIFNATCPRNPEELQIKMADEKFRAEQKRRAQTEARIGVFKQKFIGCKMQRKGFENREEKIHWSILTHNLWVIARISRNNQENQIIAQAA